MIVSLENAKEYLTLDISEERLKKKILAVEALVRSYTSNNFQERRIRTEAETYKGKILWKTSYLAVGDTVEITESLNSGLYTVAAVTADGIIPDTEVYDCSYNLITKVVYPADVQEGVLNLLKWEYTMRGKVGIKSETLSRHSVTYADQDAGNQVMGYPASLMGFLDPYMRARF